MKPGRVTLVGAGPGDPELITVRGANVLRDADVVLFDELACDDLLALAPATAEAMQESSAGTAPAIKVEPAAAAQPNWGSVLLAGADVDWPPHHGITSAPAGWISLPALPCRSADRSRVIRRERGK